MDSVGASLVVRVTDEQGQQFATKFENVDTVSLEKVTDDGATAINLRKADGTLTKAKDSAVRFKKIGIEFDGKQTLSLKTTDNQDQQDTKKFENVDTVYLEKVTDDGATAITVRKADESWIKAIDNAIRFKKIGVESVGPEIGGGKVDKNGVVQLYATLPGKESYEPDHNFRSDGKRFDFNEDYTPALDLYGYFKIVKNVDDEISPKVFGGPHSESNKKAARCYDFGIDNRGKHVRLRIEHEHLGGGKGYTGDLIKKSTDFDSFIGRWVGVRFLGYHEADKKRTRLVILIDNKGLTTDGKPANEWKVVIDEWDTGQWDPKVRGKCSGEYMHGTPYGKYPYENGQQTLRLDGVGGSNDLEWKFLSCRAIDPTKPLSQLLKNP
jgi:hypothetical protein